MAQNQNTGKEKNTSQSEHELKYDGINLELCL